jgi:hypothetical protein
MKNSVFTVLAIVLAAMLGAAAYWQWQDEQSNVVESPAIVAVSPDTEVQSEPRYPIPTVSPDAESAPEALPDEQPATEPLLSEAPPEPLPTLNTSSAVLTERFSDLFGENWLPDLFRLDEVIRRFVVTVDNLTNSKLPQQHLLVKPVAGVFMITGEGDERTISPDNAARYAPYVKLATRVDTQQLVALYVRFYPLFQEAYAELGKPDAYFNDRLVEVIDHLLLTPSPDEPLRLVQPKVFYEYADPELQALSAGQKVLLRMGSANAEQLKEKLRELRQALTQESPPQ